MKRRETATAPVMGRTEAHLGYDGLHRLDVDALHADLAESDRKRQERTLTGAWFRWRSGLLVLVLSFVLFEPISRAGWPGNMASRSVGVWTGLGLGVVVLAFEVRKSQKVSVAAQLDEHTAKMQADLQKFTGPGWFGRTVWDGIKFGAGLGVFVSAVVVMGAIDGGAGVRDCIRLAAIAEPATIAVGAASNFWYRSRILKRARRFVIRS
jgi:hypothetical protein